MNRITSLRMCVSTTRRRHSWWCDNCRQRTFRWETLPWVRQPCVRISVSSGWGCVVLKTTHRTSDLCCPWTAWCTSGTWSSGSPGRPGSIRCQPRRAYGPRTHCKWPSGAGRCPAGCPVCTAASSWGSSVAAGTISPPGPSSSTPSRSPDDRRWIYAAPSCRVSSCETCRTDVRWGLPWWPQWSLRVQSCPARLPAVLTSLFIVVFVPEVFTGNTIEIGRQAVLPTDIQGAAEKK